MAAPQVHAEPGASTWAAGNLAQARLLAGHFDGKVWQAGVEIRLKGKAHTYWRQPGDGGVPPDFNFSRSVNAGNIQVLFPAPMRGGRKGEEFIGYEQSVVFPVRIAPADTKQPVTLDLTLNYAACEKICVPEQAKLRLELTPGQAYPATASMIARYAARVPASLKDPDAPKITVSVLEPGKRWRIETAGQSPARDLFIEASGGWYFDVFRKADAFEVVLAQKPAQAGALPGTHVTVTTARGAFEGPVSLP